MTVDSLSNSCESWTTSNPGCTLGNNRYRLLDRAITSQDGTCHEFKLLRVWAVILAVGSVWQPDRDKYHGDRPGNRSQNRCFHRDRRDSRFRPLDLESLVNIHEVFSNQIGFEVNSSWVSLDTRNIQFAHLRSTLICILSKNRTGAWHMIAIRSFLTNKFSNINPT